MINKLKKIIKSRVADYEFRIFRRVLERYGVDIYLKDRMGFFVKRVCSDNFRFIFENNYSCDAVPMMLALDGIIKNDDVCIDVGANIGVTTIWLAKKCKSVYSFEPEINNLNRLKENIEINNIGNVEVIQKAVSSKSEKVVLNLFESYGHHSLSDAHLSTSRGQVLVDAISLDDFCEYKGIKEIGLLKIDVEGFEYEVLVGAKELLYNKKIKLIIFEYSPVLLKMQNRDKQQVINLLIQYGYKIYRLSHIELRLEDVDSLGQEDLYAVLE